MALCSNATSLFELAFGVNAVYAALSIKLLDTKSQLTDVVLAQFLKADPQFLLRQEDRPHLEQWASVTFTGFRLASKFKFFLQINALLMMAISGITLYQSAIWGEKCKIPDSQLAIYSLVALLASPAIYHVYNEHLKFLLLIINKHSFKNTQQTKALIRLFNISLGLKKSTENFEEAMEAGNSVLEEARANIKAMKAIERAEIIQNLIHPIQFAKRKINYWRIKRSNKSTEKPA